MSASFNSVLFGARLRRLRGGRSLSALAAMAREPRGCASVRLSRSTLSMLEQGSVQPTVDSVYALSRLHRVSFAGLLGQLQRDGDAEVMLSAMPARRACSSELHAAVSSHRWDEGAAVARRSRVAPPDLDHDFRWRLLEATCAHAAGNFDDAISMLHELVDRPGISVSQRSACLQALAMACHDAGLTITGLCHARRALGLESVERILAERAVRVHDRLVVECHAIGLLDEPSELRAVVARGERDGGLSRCRVAAARVEGLLLAARARLLTGERREARRALRSVAVAAIAAGWPEGAAWAHLYLARSWEHRGRRSHAERHWNRAANIAVEHGCHDVAFAAYFDLHRFAQANGLAERERYLRRARRFHPLTRIRTREVLAFRGVAGAPRRRPARERHSTPRRAAVRSTRGAAGCGRETGRRRPSPRLRRGRAS